MSAQVARQAAAPAFTPTPATLLQRACACGGVATFTGKCSGCESEQHLGVQPKLAISRPGDIYEQEADRIADAVVSVPGPEAPPPEDRDAGTTLHRKVTPLIQREAEAGADRDDEDEVVQPRRAAGPEGAGPDFQARLDAHRGGGAPLEPALRGHMESRFGVDLGHVRIHQGGEAARLAKDIQAEAFTLGSHVYFGAGYYDPRSRRGRHLLAHELTHTIQQRRGDVRPAAPAADPAAATPAEAAAPDPAGVVQRNPEDSFVPQRLPAGELVHQTILQELGEANPALFTEVKIPGATSLGTADNAGRADLYMDVDPRGKGRKSATTPAVIMLEDEPRYLESHRDLRKGGQRFTHLADGAPRGRRDKETSCDDQAGVNVCRVDKGPQHILLGDLKPPPSLTNFFGGRIQLGNYDSGIANTSSALNTYIRNNPAKAHPQGATWSPKTGRIAKLKIPAGRQPRSPQTTKEGLRLYDGRKEDFPISGLVGHLAVYKSQEDGIWNYEWIPEKIPAQIKKHAASERVRTALERLNGLVKKVRAPPAANQGGKKPLAHAPRPAPTLMIQRQETYDAKTWPGEFHKWQQEDAKPLLGSDAIGPLGALSVGGTKESEEGRSLRVLDGARELKSRLPTEDQPADLKQMPARPSAAETGFRRMKLWARWGGLFGRLRSVMGTVFLKIASLYETAKEKFDKVRSGISPKADDVAGGSIGKAIINGALRVAGAFFKVLVHRVVDQLKRSLKQAATVIIEDLIGEDRIKKILEAKGDVEEVVAAAEGKVAGAIEKIRDFSETFETIFKIIADVKEWAGKIERLVSAVRWGLRIINCLTPPGVGCLKLIIQSIVESLASKVISSCWFVTNYIRPLIAKFDFFKKLPGQVSEFIMDKIKTLVSVLPLSTELLDKAFAPPKVSAQTNDSDLECDPKTLTPAQRAMNKLMDDYGREHVLEMIKILEAAGLSRDAEMTLADVEVVRGLLDKIRTGEVTKEEIETATENLKAGGPAGVTDIDATVNRISGLAGGGGSGGGSGSGNGSGDGGKVRRQTYAQAKSKIPPKGGAVEGTIVQVVGGKPDAKVGDKVTITLAGLVNGRQVSEITGVPAEVVEVRSETLEDKPHTRAVYKIESTVLFTHDVKGVAAFVADPARPIPGRAFPAAETPAARDNGKKAPAKTPVTVP